jgi:hypothetical protein
VSREDATIPIQPDFLQERDVRLFSDDAMRDARDTRWRAAAKRQPVHIPRQQA